MPRQNRPHPRDFTTDWPSAPATTPTAEAVRLLATALRAALGTASVRDAAARTGMSHAVIARILAGTSWPDAETIARLESELGRPLWPTRTRAGYRARYEDKPRPTP